MGLAYKAMVITKHKSGLPRDNIVNTFWFKVVGETSAEQTAIMNAVRDFYTAIPSGQTNALMEKFGDQVAVNGHEIRLYLHDEEDGSRLPTEGAPPVNSLVFNHTGVSRGSNGGLPSEVAVCLSFRNNSVGTVPAAQRRGRIYFGPLASGQITEGSDFETPRPNVALLPLLRAAGNGLKTAMAATTAWSVYSRPRAFRPETPRAGRSPLRELSAHDGALYPVEQVWTDDAFDTQRRRGERATARTYL